jgi:hypothetical protein
VLDARRKYASIVGRQGKYSQEDEWREGKKTPVLRKLRAWGRRCMWWRDCYCIIVA